MQTPLDRILGPIGSRRPKVTAGGWTPASLTGLIQWLKAGAGIGVSDGQPVPTWADQSAAADNAAGFTANPTFAAAGGPNGQPAVLFNGSQGMSCGGTDLESCSFVIVARNTVDNNLCVCGNVAVSGLVLLNPSSTQYQSLGGNVAAPTAYTLGDWTMVEAHATGTTCQFGIDGNLSTATANVDPWTPVALGFSHGVLYNALIGGIAEVIVTSPVMSGGDQTLTHAYIAAKYAIPT